MMSEAANDLQMRWQKIRDAALAAASLSGRSLNDITIVAVTKNFPASVVREAVLVGASVFGENRVQEAAEKIPLAGSGMKWHLIGHLQTNKVKTAVGLFDLIQSVDSVRLARAISDESIQLKKMTRVLLQVNISGEEQKYGFEPARIYAAVDEISQLQSIRVEGLMGIAPLEGGETARRAAFKNLKLIFGALKSAKFSGVEMKYLSLGMSDDFAEAIEEGSNMIRVGRALFGER